MPEDTWIKIEETPEKNVPIVCIGYIYNKKNVVKFILTRGTGRTIYRKPYEASLPDTHGNICIHLVSCPEILSIYFKYSNCVDVHNQVRQFDLCPKKE